MLLWAYCPMNIRTPLHGVIVRRCTSPPNETEFQRVRRSHRPPHVNACSEPARSHRRRHFSRHLPAPWIGGSGSCGSARTPRLLMCSASWMWNSPAKRIQKQNAPNWPWRQHGHNPAVESLAEQLHLEQLAGHVVDDVASAASPLKPVVAVL